MSFFSHSNENLINIIMCTPLLCALLSLLLLKFKRYMSIPIFMVSVASSVASICLIRNFVSADLHFENVTLLWGAVANIEPITLVFILMVSSLWSVTNLYSLSYLKMNKEIIPSKFYLFLSISIFCTFGIAISPNLVAMFIFYELLTISTYPLVSHLGGQKERSAARYYLYTLMVGSLLLFLPAILYLMNNIGHTSFAIGGIASFLPGTTLTVLFLLCFYGVAKSAVVPMHTWLPEAMVASFPVSAVLHAVAVVKSGIFIMMKISVYTFGLDYLRGNILSFCDTNIITILAAISLLISSLIALYQTRIKLLLAYSTINQLSICLLSLSMFHSLALKAAAIHMVSHAFGKITLFFASGYVYCNSKISNLKDFRGLGKKMKLIMVIFTIAALSIIGLPVFGGFISKAYIYYAALSNGNNYVVLSVLTVSVLMTAHYFIKILYNVYKQPAHLSRQKEIEYEHKLLSSMTVAIIITSVGTVFFVFIYEYIMQLMDLIQY